MNKTISDYCKSILKPFTSPTSDFNTRNEYFTIFNAKSP
nr:MAG TPA: hypothetical protein [Caudoviricetes sp.]